MNNLSNKLAINEIISICIKACLKSSSVLAFSITAFIAYVVKSRHLNCILMFFNGSDPRFDEYVEKQIQIYLKIFPIQDFWTHVSLIFTKCYEYFPQQIFDRMKEERINGFISVFKEKVNLLTEKFNPNSMMEYNNLTEEEKSTIPRPEIISQPLELKAFFVDTADVIEPYTYERTNKIMEQIEIIRIEKISILN